MSIVLMILAVYRLSRMIALEDGPFDPFSEIRGKIDPDMKTWIGRGLNCPLCIGFWVALIVVALVDFSFLNWFSVAGGAAFLIKMESDL